MDVNNVKSNFLIENIINRQRYCCSETKQPTIEANSYNSERIYISPFIKTYISEDTDYII